MFHRVGGPSLEETQGGCCRRDSLMGWVSRRERTLGGGQGPASLKDTMWPCSVLGRHVSEKSPFLISDGRVTSERGHGPKIPYLAAAPES